MNLAQVLLAAQSPLVEEASGWAEFFQKYGGWAVSVVFLLGLLKLWKENKDLNERIFGILDKHGTVLGAVSELTTLVKDMRRDK
jgi:hypothetical protein